MATPAEREKDYTEQIVSLKRKLETAEAIARAETAVRRTKSNEYCAIDAEKPFQNMSNHITKTTDCSVC